MDTFILITGFLFGAVYNGLAVHVTDKLTNTNFYWMIGNTAIGTGVTGLIAYLWPYSFNVGLLCGTGTVFLAMIAFVLYALTCKNEWITQHKHYCTPFCSDVLFLFIRDKISYHTEYLFRHSEWNEESHELHNTYFCWHQNTFQYLWTVRPGHTFCSQLKKYAKNASVQNMWACNLVTSHMYTRNTNPFFERDPLVFL